MVTQHRLALLIDAENISHNWGPEIYQRIVRTQGKPRHLQTVWQGQTPARLGQRIEEGVHRRIRNVPPSQ